MSEEIIALGEEPSRRAQAAPDGPAVSCRKTTLTRGQLEASSNRIACALECLGIKLGDLFTIALPNGVAAQQARCSGHACVTTASPE